MGNIVPCVYWTYDKDISPRVNKQRIAYYLRVLERFMPASKRGLDRLGRRIYLTYPRGRTQCTTRVFLSRTIK